MKCWNDPFPTLDSSGKGESPYQSSQACKECRQRANKGWMLIAIQTTNTVHRIYVCEMCCKNISFKTHRFHSFCLSFVFFVFNRKKTWVLSFDNCFLCLHIMQMNAASSYVFSCSCWNSFWKMREITSCMGNRWDDSRGSKWQHMITQLGVQCDHRLINTLVFQVFMLEFLII